MIRGAQSSPQHVRGVVVDDVAATRAAVSVGGFPEVGDREEASEEVLNDRL